MLKKDLSTIGKLELTRKEFLTLGAFMIASLVGIIGVLEQLQSHAKTPTLSLESEDGTLSINVKSITDTSASSGKAVTFNTKTTPPPPPSGLMIGIDIATNGITSQNTLGKEYTRIISNIGITQSRLPLGNHTKFFDGGSILNAASNYTSSGFDGTPVLCHKSDVTSDYASRLAAITKPEIWVYWQEQGANKGPTTADYNATYLHMDQARKASSNGHLVSLLMDGSSSQENQQIDWPNKNPKAANVDYIGLDTYRGPSKMSQTPALLFADSLNWHNAVKGTYSTYKGVVVPEYGVADVSGVSDASRASIIQGDFSWLSSHGYTWVNYWDENNSDANSNWSVDGYPQCTTALRNAITRENLVG